MSASVPVLNLVQVVGWCLVHFLWQGFLVAGLYAAARIVLPRGNPRYLAAMAAMVLLAALPVATGWHEFRLLLAQPADVGDMMAAAGPGRAAMPAAAGTAGWLALLRMTLPWLVLAWGCGVAFLVGRVFRQWRGLRAIVREGDAAPAWQERARALARSLGLRHAVRILVSAQIATPTLVGWIRPVVVVPLALLARMPTEQVDLILVHELAHLRRLDHLANLFQVAVETLLFYHPAVYWISRDARNERELCCDALALAATGGKRRDFVAALAGLAEFHTAHADLALAASGGILVERAWFIAGHAPERRRGLAGFTWGGLMLVGVVIALALAWRQDVVRQRVEHVLAANEASLRQGLAAVADRAVPIAYGVPNWRPTLAPISPPRVFAPAPATVSAPLRIQPARVAPRLLSVPDIEAAAWHLSPVAADLAMPSTNLRAAPSLAATPRALHTVPPAYPARARLNGTQGRVEIQFALSTTGVPEHLQVVDSSGSGQLDGAALAALSLWRFAPPATPGRQYRQSFAFRLGAGAGAAGADEAQECEPSTGTHICRQVYGGPRVRLLELNH